MYIVKRCQFLHLPTVKVLFNIINKFSSCNPYYGNNSAHFVLINIFVNEVCPAVFLANEHVMEF